MPIVTIENVGQFGLITDQRPHELPMNAWSSVQNMRFRRNRAERMTGYTALTTPSVDPYFLLYWETSLAPYWFYGDTNSVYRTDGAAHLNVTRDSGPYNAGAYPTWNGGVLGGVPILNNANGVDYPQEWHSASSKFQNLSNWPVNTYAKVVRPYLNYLIALNITKTTTNYPTLVKWSHPADPGSVPSSWDETDTTKDAGEYPLSGTTGEVIDCLPLAGINVIYKTDSTWFMRPSGSRFIFQSGSLFRGKGILARDCVVEFERKHFVVGISDIWVHDGNTPQSIIEGRMRDYFYTNLSSENYENTYVYADVNKTEIHVCFPVSGVSVPNKDMFWNWTTGAWSLRDLPNGWAFAAPGVINTSAATDIFDDGTTIAFDEDTETFGTRNYNPTVFRIMAAEPGATKQLHLGDVGLSNAGVVFPSALERTGLPIAGQGPNGPVVDQSQVKFCRAVYPDVLTSSENQTVDVYVGGQDTISSAVRWSGPHPFNPSADTKVDCAVSGRLLAIRFESTQALEWECAGYKLDLDVGGMF